jgi:glycosyltransferase involved in cell wall biosynthesis
MTAPVYLEVCALFEEQWTGIGTVVAAVTKQALADPSVGWRFIYETVELPRALMERLLEERTGATARTTFAERIWEQEHVPYAEAAGARAVFTNTIKPTRGLFGQEAMIVYDLSPILTPQFHNMDTINHFANRFRADVESSVHFFPISKATRDDLETYFGVARAATSVVPMGIDMDLGSLSLAQQVARTHQVEPYVAILGTLEPRKNGRLMLEYLARNPGFVHRFKVVLIGRNGWLEERERLVRQAEAAGVPRDRIVFTGYVSEREKVGLLYNATFCIYPSFFEGYGLPILEAAVLGKLIVCSNTSSMPEVAPEQCFFFDPGSILEFSRAVGLAEKRALQLRLPLALPEIAERLAHHSWEPCYAAIRAWALA